MHGQFRTAEFGSRGGIVLLGGLRACLQVLRFLRDLALTGETERVAIEQAVSA